MADLNFDFGSEHYGVWYPALRPIHAAVKGSGKFIHSAFFEYEPGNATRYKVLFNTIDNGYGPETVMTVMNFSKSMIVNGPMHSPTQIGYMREKLGLGEGDCYALMPLINHYLEELGK